MHVPDPSNLSECLKLGVNQRGAFTHRPRGAFTNDRKWCRLRRELRTLAEATSNVSINRQGRKTSHSHPGRHQQIPSSKLYVENGEFWVETHLPDFRPLKLAGSMFIYWRISSPNSHFIEKRMTNPYPVPKHMKANHHHPGSWGWKTRNVFIYDPLYTKISSTTWSIFGSPPTKIYTFFIKHRIYDYFPWIPSGYLT